MNSKPIPFPGPEVRAILDGRKTQTRRVGKIQNSAFTELGVQYIGHQTKGTVAQATYRAYPGRGTARHAICECPYGVPGDQLWASRLTLEITDIRVQRLQDISEEDAKAEGSFLGRCDCMPHRKDKTPFERAFRQTWCHIHGQEFHDLWDFINAKRGFGWDSNPWVWALTFKRL